MYIFIGKCLRTVTFEFSLSDFLDIYNVLGTLITYFSISFCFVNLCDESYLSINFISTPKIVTMCLIKKKKKIDELLVYLVKL